MRFEENWQTKRKKRLEGLLDKRLNGVSHCRAPVDEVVRLEVFYKKRYDSWKVKHFYSKYQGEHAGIGRTYR